MKIQKTKSEYYLNVYDKTSHKFVIKEQSIGFNKEDALKKAKDELSFRGNDRYVITINFQEIWMIC